jgi:hypothetical protein
MNLTINLSEHDAAALEAQARAAHMPAKDYLSTIVARVLERQRAQNAENLSQHLDKMAGKIVPETTSAEMEAAFTEALAQVRPHRTWQS